MITFDYRHILPFVSAEEIQIYAAPASVAARKLIEKTGAGNAFLGWLDYPRTLKENEIDEIIEVGEEINRDASVLIVIGIGGSYLGAQAVMDMLGEYFPARRRLEIIFAGNTLSGAYTEKLLKYLEDKDFCVNVISKSGTTTEPAIAFRLFRRLLREKYGSDYYKRVYCTTTLGKGALYEMARKNGYRLFSIPEDIGGRYSVFTPVGLLPLAAAGIDIKALIAGARAAAERYQSAPYPDNEAMLYAAIRNLLYQKGKLIELLVLYEPKTRIFGEWYKQLFGESEGKDHKGIFPASALYTTDLHSLGQYVQDGKRHLFETVVDIMEPESDVAIPVDDDDADGLNYLAGKTLNEVNRKAMRGTALAHVAGEVPNMLVRIDRMDPYHIGVLLYFFMFACGVSGYLLGINPFDQEGVESYKRNMFALLGRKGYEELRKKLEEL